MTAETEPAFVAETLAWCNERRAERGKKPLKRMPKGVRENPYSCPCGKACDIYVEYDWWWPRNVRDYWPSGGQILPPDVQAFVDAFDAGELPQYEAKA